MLKSSVVSRQKGSNRCFGVWWVRVLSCQHDEIHAVKKIRKWYPSTAREVCSFYGQGYRHRGVLAIVMVQLISVTPETHRAYVELTCPLTRPEVNALNAVCVLLRCACARPVTKKRVLFGKRVTRFCTWFRRNLSYMWNAPKVSKAPLLRPAHLYKGTAAVVCTLTNTRHATTSTRFR